MDNVRESLRNEEVKKIMDSMDEDYSLNKVYEMIKDNKIEFDFEGKQYRVRLLNMKEKEELDTLRRKKFGQLLQDRDILLEKDLIEIYKERGMNIEELDSQLSLLNTRLNETSYKLGEALEAKNGETIFKTYKEEIIALESEIYQIMIQKTHLLEYSLENQLQNYVAKIISYLSLDIYTEGVWIRAYNNIDTFLSAEEKLVNFTGMYSMALHYKIG